MAALKIFVMCVVSLLLRKHMHIKNNEPLMTSHAKVPVPDRMRNLAQFSTKMI